MPTKVPPRFTLLLTLLFASILPSTQSDAAVMLVENWDTNAALDASWSNTGQGDVQRFVDITQNELNLIVRPFMQDGGLSRSRVRFQNPGDIDRVLATTIRLMAINHASGMGYTVAQLSAIFYNKNLSPVDATGDVSATVRIGDRGNGLEAWLSAWESTNASFTDALETSITLVPPGTLALNTDYQVSLVYDGSNSFTATITDGGALNVTQTVDGPDRPAAGGASFFRYKALEARVSADSTLTSDPDANKIHAVFSSIRVDNEIDLYDDLTTPLQSSKFGEPDSASTVTSNMLKMQAKSAGTEASEIIVENTVDLPNEFNGYPLLQADLKLEGNAVPTATRAEVTMKGYWGNGEHVNGSDNGDGSIVTYSIVRKERESDDYKVCCIAEMQDWDFSIATPPDTWVTIFGECVNIPSPDTMYTFTVKKVGTQLSCQVSETASGQMLISKSGDAKTIGINTIYPVGQRTTLRARVRDNHPAEAIGYFDNIYVGDISGLLLNVVPVIMSIQQEKQ